MCLHTIFKNTFLKLKTIIIENKKELSARNFFSFCLFRNKCFLSKKSAIFAYNVFFFNEEYLKNFQFF